VDNDHNPVTPMPEAPGVTGTNGGVNVDRADRMVIRFAGDSGDGMQLAGTRFTDAAAIDGAGFWTTFFRISLPAIWPVMAIALLIRGLDLIRIFDVVWALTQGGPGTMTETLSIYTYIQGFRQFETSYTGAIAFVVIVVLTLVVIWLLRRMEIDR